MSYKVFFVEDEIITREGIRDNIDWRASGFEFCGEASDGELALPLLRAAQPDVLITDPPRAGMHDKLVKKILEVEAPLVVYVSCNPATQGRDLNLLDEKYAVTAVQPVDMFPHTSHIENVVQLKLR